MEKSTWEKPHTFHEGVAWLLNDHIDYEVVIGRHHGALMTVLTWLEDVRSKSFIDYDGFGNAVDLEGNIINSTWYYPSMAAELPPETAFILWYNR